VTKDIQLLSYPLTENMPCYGGSRGFRIKKEKDMHCGGTCNSSSFEMNAHAGTHLDVPYHFFQNGQKIKNFNIDYFLFKKPLYVFLEKNLKDTVIKEEITESLREISDENFDCLIVKTGFCDVRETEEYWNNNPGIHGDIAPFLREKFPSVRLLGFDSISLSGYQNRPLGREAHKRFLHPSSPILILEDLDLREVTPQQKPISIDVIPLMIEESDGLPCTVLGRY
tara:strand:- start:12438 stop:13112 length:675 start_codon:yes stop_codon:yes gene_type:complete